MDRTGKKKYRICCMIVAAISGVVACLFFYLYFFCFSPFRLVFAESGFMDQSARALVKELNSNYNKYFWDKKIDLYAGGYANPLNIDVLDDEHINVLWLGSYSNVHFDCLKNFDYIFATTPELTSLLKDQGYNVYYLPLFYANENSEISSCSSQGGKDCFFGIIGERPMFEAALQKRGLSYKKYDISSNVITDIERDVKHLSGLAIGKANFEPKSLDLHPLFLKAIYYKIPLIVNTVFSKDFASWDNQNLRFFGDSIFWYTIPTDIDNFLDHPYERQKKVNEAIDFSKRYASAQSGAEIIARAIRNLGIKDNTVLVDSPVVPGFYNNGDFWLAKDLTAAMNGLGYLADTHFIGQPVFDVSNISIFIRGGTPMSADWAKDSNFRIIYLIFTPFFDGEPQNDDNKSFEEQYSDLIKEFSSADIVTVASALFAQKLTDDGIKAYYVPQFTNTNKFYPDYDEKLQSEVLFVGNRLSYRVAPQIVYLNNLPISVYGNYWPEGFAKALYIDNQILRKYYSSAKIVLNDTRKGMKKFGFISNRIFDATACETLVISDYIPEIEEIYGDSVPMWKTEEELVNLVKYYLDPAHEEERKAKAKRAREITLKNFTADIVAKKFFEIIDEVKKEREKAR